MFRLLLNSSVVLVLSAAPLYAVVKGEEVTYKAGDTVLRGYLAYDDAVKGKRPGVIVIHEWWGHNEYVRKRARMLAGLGYTALAVDMYGDGKTADHPDNAKALMDALVGNAREMHLRFNAAHAVLKKNKATDARRIGAIGYSMGGVIVLQMARDGADIAGVANFYGTLGTKNTARPGKVKAKILVLNGANDPLVPPESVEAFKKEMDVARADYKFVNYPGAKHSFTVPDADVLGSKFNLPFAYHAEADRKSWAEMQAFFERIFR